MDREEASVPLHDLTRSGTSVPLALIPKAATQFPGSFAAHKRHQEQEQGHHVSFKVGAVTSIWLYFNDGWQNVSIWKSAVGACFPFHSYVVWAAHARFA